MNRHPFWPSFVAIVVMVSLSGCASMASQKLSKGLASAMLNQDDPETVRAGASAYLLLIDSFISDSPGDKQLLMAGAQLYGAYSSGLTQDKERGKRLSQRAKLYANRAFCLSYGDLCKHDSAPFETFEQHYRNQPITDHKLLFTYATAWAGWIRSHSDDWNAVADLPKVELLLEKLIAEDPSFAEGRAQLYLAVMKSQLPASLGGQPEAGRTHFEKAIAFSNGRDLIAKVEFAKRYARLTFDQALHDKLLKEVLESDPYQTDLTLSNILAQKEAARLLEEEYF